MALHQALPRPVLMLEPTGGVRHALRRVVTRMENWWAGGWPEQLDRLVSGRR